MGKYLICSHHEDYEKITSLFKGFTISATGKSLFGEYAAYRKLRLHTENRFQDGDDFAVGVGTFIYKGDKDAGALKGILRDWTGDLNIRENIIGSYCIGVYKNGEFSLFVDECASYKLYYYLDTETNRFAATTTFYHLAKGMNCSVDDEAFLGDVFFCNVGGCTMCPQVHWLTGERELHYQDGVWTVRRIVCPNEKLDTGLCEYLKDKYKDIPHVFTQSATFLTGGQDSRITLAFMLALGMKPTCCYGIGDSTVTNTKNEDMHCVQRIAEQNDLPVYLMNWKDSDLDGCADYLSKYGEQYTIYGASKNFFGEFEEKMEGEFFTFGYLGEAFRAVEAITDYPQEYYTLEQYVDDIYLQPFRNQIQNSAFLALRENVYQQYCICCGALEMDIKHITKDEFQILNSFYRLRWDMRMNQLANMFFYSFPLFADRKAYNYIDHVPYHHKLYSKFQMECIEEFYPSLLEIPFFSHIKPKSYNPETHELTEKQLVVGLKDKVKKRVTNPTLYRFFRYMYYILRGDMKGLQEIHQMNLNIQDNENLIEGEKIRSILNRDLTVFSRREAVNIQLHEYMRASIEK